MDCYGQKFIIELFGASHTPELGVTITGVPASLPVCEKDFEKDLLRRKSGRLGTTPRIESDIPHIEDHRATDGTVRISFSNDNFRPQDYSAFKDIPRPGHADFVAFSKYGSLRDGYFSGRMTLPVVAAGVIAKKLIDPISVNARIIELGGIPASDETKVTEALASASEEGDSLGAVIECTCTGVPVGVGEPFFDSLESHISHAMFSIPGIRGVEFGDGFKAASMKGSDHNDPFADGTGRTLRNGAGGINGGISNGNPIIFRIAVKPTSSIRKAQTTFDFSKGEMTEISVPGRHDVCFALRVPPVVEAMTAIVLANLI